MVGEWIAKHSVLVHWCVLALATPSHRALSDMDSEDESLSTRPRSQQRGALHKSSKSQRSSMYRKTQSLDHQMAEDRVSAAIHSHIFKFSLLLFHHLVFFGCVSVPGSFFMFLSLCLSLLGLTFRSSSTVSVPIVDLFLCERYLFHYLLFQSYPLHRVTFHIDSNNLCIAYR